MLGGWIRKSYWNNRDCVYCSFNVMSVYKRVSLMSIYTLRGRPFDLWGGCRKQTVLAGSRRENNSVAEIVQKPYQN